MMHDAADDIGCWLAGHACTTVKANEFKVGSQLSFGQ